MAFALFWIPETCTRFSVDPNILGILAIGAMGVVVISLIWYILQIVADWKIFSKAGRPGILSLIPFVNICVEYGICWSTAVGVLFAVCLAVTGAVNSMEKPSTFASTAALIASLCATVLHVVQSFKLAKAFGKGTGYGIFLILFGPLARVILGVGGSEYVGKA